MNSTILEEDELRQETIPVPPQTSGFPMPMFPVSLSTTPAAKTSPKPIRPVPILPLLPPSSPMVGLNLNHKIKLDPLPLSLKLSTTPSSSSAAAEQPTSSAHSSSFQAMPSGDNNSIISVS
ncbi:hypothetical protein GQ457_18G021230 [Hibiscus cannabinus]